MKKQLEVVTQKLLLQSQTIEKIKSSKISSDPLEKLRDDLKKIEYDCDAKILKIMDIINTKVTPLMDKMARNNEGIAKRIDAFFKNRSKNQYLNGEEQRGMGVNVEAIKAIEKKLLPNRENNTSFKFIPIDENLDNKIITKALNDYEEYESAIAKLRNPTKYFREIYLE